MDSGIIRFLLPTFGVESYKGVYRTTEGSHEVNEREVLRKEYKEKECVDRYYLIKTGILIKLKAVVTRAKKYYELQLWFVLIQCPYLYI